MFIEYIVVRLDKNHTYSKSFYKIFQLFDKRIELILTEDQFEKYRKQLMVDGLVLHEIERKLNTPSETIQ